MALPITAHLELTCAADRRAHRVDGAAFDAGVAAHDGRFRALCGHLVAVMSMSDPPGPPCRRCAQLADHGSTWRRSRR